MGAAMKFHVGWGWWVLALGVTGGAIASIADDFLPPSNEPNSVPTATEEAKSEETDEVPNTGDSTTDKPAEDNAGNDAAKPAAEDPGPPPEGSPAEKQVKIDPSAMDETNSSSDEPKPPTPPVEEEKPLSPELIKLRDKLRKCLNVYYHSATRTVDHSPWGIMHHLISYGADSEIWAADKRVSTAGWLCWNGSCRGMTMLHTTRDGLAVRIGPGYQGHPGQFLAILAQSRVKEDYPIRIDDKEFTVKDLIAYEQKTCREKTELTFKLIGLSHYLSSDATWKDDRGQEWSIPRLIKEEIGQTITGAACGGTHRLTGLAYSVRNREKAGLPIEGQWLKARKYLDEYHAYTFKLQNPDGSFSTRWFEGREDYGEKDRRVQTTGHMLEWLVYSLPQEELGDERVIKAVNYLVDTMAAHPNHKWEIGPKGHALHGLNIYDRRMFGARMGERVQLAREQRAKKLAALEAEKAELGTTESPKPAPKTQSPDGRPFVAPKVKR